jgi:FKBP-type peptidyl-prolyl cis-trans isomerase
MQYLLPVKFPLNECKNPLILQILPYNCMFKISQSFNPFLLICTLMFISCSGHDQEAYKAHKKENENFLKQNASKEGVKTLPSGLQYMVLKEGYGPSPELNESVTVQYHGTLIDGTVFDSSIEKGKPLTFDVNQVISGWQEALQLMPQGAKWRVFIPSHLGYGARGLGSKIKPNSVLIFEMELISING